MKHDFSILTKRLAKINFANTPITIMEFAKQANLPYNKGARHFWKFVEYCQENCQWYRNTSTTKQDFNTWQNLWNSFNKTNFASIDKKKLLNKYNLDGEIDIVTNDLHIYPTNEDSWITIGGNDVEDPGWVILNEDKIIANNSWKGKSKQELSKSVDDLYVKCNKLFGKDFASKIKGLALDLISDKTNFASIDDFITDSGKALRDKYNALLKKYDLNGDMEMSGCLSIYGDNDLLITLGGKDLEDMSGWTISDDNGKIIAEEGWEEKDDKEIEKSIDRLYNKCTTLFDKTFADKIKKIIMELNK